MDMEEIIRTLLVPFEVSMGKTMQSSKWHGEGDVYTHTLMVSEALKSLPEYQQLEERKRTILLMAALLHDIGKIPTTEFTDDWHSPHHAPVGSRMARELLWKDYGYCGQKDLMEFREAVCLLVRYHTFPVHALEMNNARLKLHRIAANGLLAPDFSIKLLCLLSKADVMGRKSDEQQQSLEKIAMCEELAKTEECYESCYPFLSQNTKRAFLSGHNVLKEQELYDDTWGEVVLMSGLPGTGKDTWIRNNLPNVPVVSLDDIRISNKISPEVEQGRVVNIAREQAKEYLRQHQPFVWNATNITAVTREDLVKLFESYQARVRIVYLETEWETELERNHSREAVINQSIIEWMLGKMELPEAYEARNVEWKTV